jgi:hypothetical protein
VSRNGRQICRVPNVVAGKGLTKDLWTSLRLETLPATYVSFGEIKTALRGLDKYPHLHGTDEVRYDVRLDILTHDAFIHDTLKQSNLFPG